MRTSALAVIGVAALMVAPAAHADFINFAQYGPTGTTISSPGAGVTTDGVGFTISDVGNAGFTEYCESKARTCAANNTWAGEFYANEVILYNNGAQSPVTIAFNTAITSLVDLQAQANDYGAFTETLTAFNGTTQVAVDSQNWFNDVAGTAYPEGSIPKLSVDFAGGITSVTIATTNDGDGFALGGIGGVNNEVPEPASWGLMMVGLAALAGLGIRRRRTCG